MNMQTEGYKLVADSASRWRVIEEMLLRDASLTEEDLAFHRSIFEGTAAALERPVPWHLGFAYLSNASLSAWQEYLEYSASEHEYTDADYLWLQLFFLRNAETYGFPPTDIAYFFLRVFGETYDAERMFPLRINKEPANRRISATSSAIFAGVMRGAKASIFSNMRKPWPDGNYLPYVLGYFDSLLPHIDQRAFGTERFAGADLSVDGGAYISGMQSVIRDTIAISRCDACEFLPEDRIDFALAIASRLEEQGASNPEFGSVLKRIEDNLEEINNDVKAGDF